jgi:SAM-dependent methyltransferase
MAFSCSRILLLTSFCCLQFPTGGDAFDPNNPKHRNRATTTPSSDDAKSTKMSMCERKTQASVNAEWNAMASEWDDLASGYRDSFLKILWEETGLEPSEERTVVDFGCGTGLLTESMRQQSPKSKFICLDAAPEMIEVLKEKIRAGEWENTKAFCIALASLYEVDQKIQSELEAIKGKVDLIVASSVMSFIPAEDLPTTMKVLGDLLKDGGVFCHSDWIKSTEHPDGFEVDKATKMYGMAGLTAIPHKNLSVKMMGSDTDNVFIGVAKK